MQVQRRYQELVVKGNDEWLEADKLADLNRDMRKFDTHKQAKAGDIEVILGIGQLTGFLLSRK